MVSSMATCPASSLTDMPGPPADPECALDALSGPQARRVAAAQERFGLRMLLGNTYRDRLKETRFFDDLLAHGVRGVIVISSLLIAYQLILAGS